MPMGDRQEHRARKEVETLEVQKELQRKAIQVSQSASQAGQGRAPLEAGRVTD
jgi:hypothetical protein